MTLEPEKPISSEKTAEPGGTWKTNEKHIVPKNRLSIVRQMRRRPTALVIP